MQDTDGKDLGVSNASVSNTGVSSADSSYADTSYLGDKAFWGLTVTQFFGAFNDNLFKQTVLLLFVAVPLVSGETADRQGLATVVFSIPFILFSGFAGFLSDRFGKRGVIFGSKVAEIFIMALGMAAFYWYGRSGLTTPVIVLISSILFLMGAQSAFFGPGKYGILPELFREGDLPGANGLILMTTFLAIIFGAALAGGLKEFYSDRLYIIGAACILIAVIGTVSALMVRRPRPAKADLQLSSDVLFIPQAVRRLLWRDRELRHAILASMAFWLSAAMVQMAINSLGKIQLKQGDAKTSIMAATISAGIAFGSVAAGSLSKNQFSPRVLKSGAIGMVVCLTLLALPSYGEHNHLLGFYGSIAILILLGGFTGLFAVPLQVFMQSRPPAPIKGRMIATQNLLVWIGITLAGAIYLLLDSFFEWLGMPKCSMFGVTALFMLCIVVLYRPKGVHFAEPPELDTECE